MRVFGPLIVAGLLLAAQPAFGASLYWSTGQGGKIQRAAVGPGMQAEDFLADLGYARSLALDIERGYVYWAESEPPRIRRAYLDGTHVEDLITAGLERPSSIALDLAGEKLYFLDSQANRIRRADFDGTNVEEVTDQVSGASAIAIDSAASKLYWTNVTAEGGLIRRADLTGSNVEVVLDELGHPAILALAPDADRIFWTNFDLQIGAGVNLGAADLDGENVEILATSAAGGLTVDPFAERLYWSSFPGGELVEATYDGSTQETLLGLSGVLPIGLAIDTSVVGDANGDRLVDTADLDLLKQYFFQGDRRSQGDFNGSHWIDLRDFQILKMAYRAQQAAVPEPSSGLLCILGIAILAARHARRCWR